MGHYAVELYDTDINVLEQLAVSIFLACHKEGAEDISEIMVCAYQITQCHITYHCSPNTNIRTSMSRESKLFILFTKRYAAITI